jgi:hypothetical protein
MGEVASRSQATLILHAKQGLLLLAFGDCLSQLVRNPNVTIMDKLEIIDGASMKLQEVLEYVKKRCEHVT